MMMSAARSAPPVDAAAWPLPPGTPLPDATRLTAARQIRNYYRTLRSDHIMAQRHEALLKVQQTLEPLTAIIIATCNG